MSNGNGKFAGKMPRYEGNDKGNNKGRGNGNAEMPR
jgi:hypothetical protein